MATYSLTDAKIYVAEFDLSGFANQATLTGVADDLDVTTFGSGGWRTRIGGLEDLTLQAGGFLDDSDTSGPDPALAPNIGSGAIITIGPTDGTAGEIAYAFQALQTSFEWGGAVGDAAGWTLQATGKDRLVRSTVIEDATTARSTTFQSTGQQVGSASASEKVWASLHVIATSGTPTLDVVVESDDNSGFTSATSRITFTQATGVTSERKSLAGAVSDDWWRINATIGGSTPSFTFAVVLGIR